MGDNNIFENAEVIEEVAEVGIKNTGKKIRDFELGINYSGTKSGDNSA